jgi:hypothetical protein
MGEKPIRRRGQGSSTMFVSRGLVDPKVVLNRSYRKGSWLIFQHYVHFVQGLKHRGIPSGGTNLFNRIILGRTVMVRTGRKRMSPARPEGVDPWCQ